MVLCLCGLACAQPKACPSQSKSLRIRLPFLGSSPWGTAAIAAPCWVSEKEGKQLFQRRCRRRWRKTPAGSTEATMHTVYCCWELRRASASLSCSSLELVLGSGALWASLLIPRDYVANPPAAPQGQPRQSCIMHCLVFLPLELLASPHLELQERWRACGRAADQ